MRLEDDWVPMDEQLDIEELEEVLRSKEAHSRAVVLESVSIGNICIDPSIFTYIKKGLSSFLMKLVAVLFFIYFSCFIYNRLEIFLMLK